jgi:phosphopantetheinyl transferase (holo-ACP synthase)
MHHHAEHSNARWASWVALSSALLAALAAVAALIAGHHANEAMVEQIKSSDQWTYYQAKGIKSAILASRMATLEALGKTVDEGTKKKIQDYENDQKDISVEAKEKEAAAAEHLRRHQIVARAVTLFQVSIAMCAISALVRRRRFWLVGLGFGGIGLGFFVQGLL